MVVQKNVRNFSLIVGIVLILLASVLVLFEHNTLSLLVLFNGVVMVIYALKIHFSLTKKPTDIENHINGFVDNMGKDVDWDSIEPEDTLDIK